MITFPRILFHFFKRSLQSTKYSKDIHKFYCFQMHILEDLRNNNNNFFAVRQFQDVNLGICIFFEDLEY